MNNFNEKMFSKQTNIGSIIKRKQTNEGVEQKFWITYNGKKYLYKIDDERHLGFGELFYCYLGQKLGFDCVNAYPAYDTKTNTKGVIIESFKPNGERTLSLKDLIRFCCPFFSCQDYACYFSYQEFMRMEKTLKTAKLEYEQNLGEKFKALVLIDYLLGQTDRHDLNMEFLLVKSQNSKNIILKMAPLFDNGRAMGLPTISSDTFEELIEDAQDTVPSLGISDDRPMCFPMNADATKKVTKYIAEAILNDKNLRVLYNKFASLDIRKEIENVNKITKYGMTEKEITYMTEYYNQRMQLLNALIVEIQNDKKADEMQMQILDDNQNMGEEYDKGIL